MDRRRANTHGGRRRASNWHPGHIGNPASAKSTIKRGAEIRVNAIKGGATGRALGNPVAKLSRS